MLKGQGSKLKVQGLQGLVSFEKFVVQSITIRSQYSNLFYFLVLQNVETGFRIHGFNTTVSLLLSDS